jgi:hypothetical protein
MELATLFVLALVAIQGVTCITDELRKNLKYFETLHAKQFGHNIVKRGLHPSNHPYNKIREVDFKVSVF